MFKELNNLRDLTLTSGISGNEIYSGITDLIFEIVRKINPKTTTDSYGNVISVFGKGKKKILIDAHLDEVGFMVSGKNNGKIELNPIGDINIQKINNSRAFVLKKNIKGRIFQEASNIFFESKNPQNQKKIFLGDVISFERSFCVEDDVIRATALDNRIGCSCLLDLMSEVKGGGEIQIIYTFTSGEESDNSTLDKIAIKYNIDFGIIVDAAYAKPVSFGTDEMSIPELGSGCAIQHLGTNFTVDKKIIDKIEKCSKNNKIDFQKEIPSPELGRTNFSKLQKVGIPGCVINIPVRDQHTQISEANKNDYDSAVNLIKSVISLYSV